MLGTVEWGTEAVLDLLGLGAFGGVLTGVEGVEGVVGETGARSFCAGVTILPTWVG